jgi:hypothetical protein
VAFFIDADVSSKHLEVADELFEPDTLSRMGRIPWGTEPFGPSSGTLFRTDRTAWADRILLADRTPWDSKLRCSRSTSLT